MIEATLSCHRKVCRGQFTVYIGTFIPQCTRPDVFVRSKISLNTEIQAPCVFQILNLSENNSLIIDGLLLHPKALLSQQKSL